MKKYKCFFDIHLEVYSKLGDDFLYPKDEVVILNSQDEIQNYMEEQSEILKTMMAGIEKYVWKNFKKRVTAKSHMSMMVRREVEEQKENDKQHHRTVTRRGHADRAGAQAVTDKRDEAEGS